MALPTGPAGQYGSLRPNIARIRDCWVNGEHHTAGDQELAQHIELVAPHVPYLVRAQRSLVRRMVRYLVDQGVTQFLDLGSGLPNRGYVHDIAQAADPNCHVLYVDAEPSLEADSLKLLAGNDQAAFVTADAREPARLFELPDFRRLINLDEPVAVLMIELLLHIPDGDDPASLVASYVDAVCPGSYLAISHFGEDEQILAGFQLFERMMFGEWPQMNLRSKDAVAGFFAGLEFVEPGLVPVPLWRPDSEDEIDRNPERVEVYAGLARKP